MASSSGKKCRIIEVEVRSATLNSVKKIGNLYVHISISESQELRTKLVNFSKTISPSWNQKFVFSVPQNFIYDGNSVVSFTVFKARKYLSDIEIGKATAEMKALFPIDKWKEDEEEEEDMHDMHDEYDTDDQDHGVEEGREPEIQAKKTFALKAAAGVPILKESCEVGRLNISIAAWGKYYPYQLNLHGRLRKSFAIFKDSDNIGSMVLQKASKQEKHYLSLLGNAGNAKWRNLAMELEEFMMLRQVQKKGPRDVLRQWLSCYHGVETKETKLFRE